MAFRRALASVPTALALALTLAAIPHEAEPAVAGPALVFEAPPRYQGLARRLQEIAPRRLAAVAELVGIDPPGPPIRVLLAPEGSAPAVVMPSWVAGYAERGVGTVVLLPARTPTYPDSSLEDVLRHEIAHVLIDRAARGRPLPRWFHEGVASIAGSSWGLDDRSVLTLALLREPAAPMSELESRFGGGRGEVERAYAVSGAFVRDLVQRHGPGVVGRILGGVAGGLSFEDAFAQAAGLSLEAAEEAFWKSQTFWYRWVPLLTSSLTLWLGIALLALLAARRRHARTAALHRQWEEEERLRGGGERGDPPH